MAANRAELTQWVASSRAVQRGLRWLLTLGLGLAFLVLLLGGGGGAFVVIAGLSAAIAGIGFWITHGHIADFENQLRTLGHRR
jgi:hypothetical protein